MYRAKLSTFTVCLDKGLYIFLSLNYNSNPIKLDLDFVTSQCTPTTTYDIYLFSEYATLDHHFCYPVSVCPFSVNTVHL